MAETIFGMPLAQAEQQYLTNPVQTSWMDYIPNIYGGLPAGYEGLLGAEQTKQIGQRSNIAGLLGAAAALSAGMSRQGAPRSALQNILGALGAGYQTAGMASEQGIKNIAMQYDLAQKQLAQSQLMQKQNAINELMKDPQVANDPAMKAWVLSNPDKALELFVKRRGMQQFLQREGQVAQPAAVSPEMAAYTEQMAPYTVSAGAQVIPSAEPVREPTQPLAAGTVETAPVPDISGQFGALPTAPKPAPKPTAHPLDAQIREADLLAKYYQGEGNDAPLAKHYQDISKNLSDRKRQEIIASNVSKSIGNVNPLIQPLVDTLVKNAPEMTSAEIQSAAMEIRKKNTDFQVNTETELRKEYAALPAIKEYSTVETAYKQIQSALSNPSAANDLAAATKFMKLLDPGSVVRESELGMAMAATGAIDRVTNYFERLKSGQILNPEQRADFKRSAELMFNAAKGTRDQISQQYVELANSYNVNPNNIVMKRGESVEQPRQTPPRNTRGWQLSVDAQGNRAYVSPDGTQFEEVK